mmetsp:Transcript_24890/g.22083  ORF Transcript_24890/g.22083 Transcript_24890/m.22083 type:complete len:80 (+) Transcript_24890:151-390(+)
MHKDIEKKVLAQEIRKEQEKEWEDGRDKRAKNWRKFFPKVKTGRKRTYKAQKEMRPKSAPKTDESRPLGIQEGYKREWK